MPSEMVMLVMDNITTIDKLKLMATCSYLYSHKDLCQKEIKLLEMICYGEQAECYEIDKNLVDNVISDNKKKRKREGTLSEIVADKIAKYKNIKNNI